MHFLIVQLSKSPSGYSYTENNSEVRIRTLGSLANGLINPSLFVV